MSMDRTILRPPLPSFPTPNTLGEEAAAQSSRDSHAHHHHRRCGHRHIIVDKRKIYDYQGRWEYYDRKSDTWYYYEDPPH